MFFSFGRFVLRWSRFLHSQKRLSCGLYPAHNRKLEGRGRTNFLRRGTLQGLACNSSPRSSRGRNYVVRWRQIRLSSIEKLLNCADLDLRSEFAGAFYRAGFTSSLFHLSSWFLQSYKDTDFSSAGTCRSRQIANISRMNSRCAPSMTKIVSPALQRMIAGMRSPSRNVFTKSSIFSGDQFAVSRWKSGFLS